MPTVPSISFFVPWKKKQSLNPARNLTYVSHLGDFNFLLVLRE